MKKVFSSLIALILVFTGCGGKLPVEYTDKAKDLQEISLPEYYMSDDINAWPLSFDGKTLVLEVREKLPGYFSGEESTLLAFDVESRQAVSEYMPDVPDFYTSFAYYINNEFYYIVQNTNRADILYRSGKDSAAVIYSSDYRLSLKYFDGKLYVAESGKGYEDIYIKQISELSDDMLVPVFENTEDIPVWKFFITGDGTFYFEDYKESLDYNSLYRLESDGSLKEIFYPINKYGPVYGLLENGILEYIRSEKPYVQYTDFENGDKITVFEGDVYSIYTDRTDRAIVYTADGTRYFLNKKGGKFTVSPLELPHKSCSFFAADDKILLIFDRYTSVTADRKLTDIFILD